MFRERCNVRSIRDDHLKGDFILIITPIVTFLNLAQQVILIVASWLFSHGENHLDPETWGNFGATRVCEYKANENRRGEDSSHRKGIEVLLTETARKGYPDTENVDNPKSAPQGYVVRQSGRGWELQNWDLWLRPTDLSWHFPILVTIREMPFKNHGARSPAKLKVREDKIEEAKKTRWKYSSWTWTTSSSSSAWREWSSDETRERTSWKSADWHSSDQVREATVWHSHFSWQWGHLHRSSQGHPWRRK